MRVSGVIKSLAQFLIFLSLSLTIGLSLAQEDVEGSKDHPILSRYPGSYIYHYDQKEFDEFEILLGPVKSPSDRDIELAKKERLEGRVTKIQYQAPKNRSPFEVFKNYEEAIKKANFDILYSARGQEIAGIRKFLYPYFWNVYAAGDDEKNFFYLSAKNKNKSVTLSVCVLPGYNGPIVLLGIVEKKEMEAGLIKAKDMYERIKSEGKVAIYGIYFDFDKAEIKPESKPTIEEIAKFLKEYPEIKLYIVGHTDNVGKLEYNVELSKRRAEAVVKELVERYGIRSDRLKAFGVGPLAPIASNSTEEGRAKNRRVELVEQLDISKRYCQTDADCACGVDKETGECAFGNKQFIDTSKQCPDFCAGIAGNLEVKCVNNICKLVEIKRVKNDGRHRRR